MLRDRDARRRPEPDHRAAEADRVGEHAPVIAALLRARARSAGCCRTPPRRSPSAKRSLATMPPAATSTGISDADSHERTAGRRVPLTRAGHDASSPGGARRSRRQDRDRDRGADVGKRGLPSPGPSALMPTLTATALARMNATMATRGQSTAMRGGRILDDRREALLLPARPGRRRRGRPRPPPRRRAARRAARRRRSTSSWSWCRRSRCPSRRAFDGRDDRREVADVHLVRGTRASRHRPADQRRGDVVEERRQHEHDREQHEAAVPVVGQERAAAACGTRLSSKCARRAARSRPAAANRFDEEHPLMGELRGEAR